jgi:hypothetical protein
VDASVAALRELQGEAQVEMAVRLLQPKSSREALRAAVRVLQRQPTDEARLPLILLVQHFGRNGGSADYGTYLRSEMMRALRPLVRQEDKDFLTAALMTYEYPPPERREDAAMLRSTALVAMAELDVELCRFHAVRLLVDGQTDPMSGEPAVTAARILANFGDMLALFQFVCSDAGMAKPEVMAAVLGGMTTLPVELIPTLLATIGERAAGVVLVGLADLLLGHESGPQGLEFLMSAVRRSDSDVVRYIAFEMVSRGGDDWIKQLVQVLRQDGDAKRRAIAAEVEALLSGADAARRNRVP